MQTVPGKIGPKYPSPFFTSTPPTHPNKACTSRLITSANQMLLINNEKWSFVNRCQQQLLVIITTELKIFDSQVVEDV
jgi:hypothetical protein